MSGRLFVLLASAILGFAFASLSLRDRPRFSEGVRGLSVHLPVPVQLANAFADPYLASNLNVFRSLMVDPRITEDETYRIQAVLQVDAAFFNPRHEDNYYVGAAILPWNGQVQAAQQVLRQAADARPWDMWPAFFYAFNAMYFERDMGRAGHWAEVAAQRHPKNAAALRDIAAKWYERGDDPRVAIGILKAMYEQSRDQSFRQMLAARLQRLDGLLALRQAAEAYRLETGRRPDRMEVLLGYAGLQQLPKDPLALGYLLDAAGNPQLSDHVQQRKSQ